MRSPPQAGTAEHEDEVAAIVAASPQIDGKVLRMIREARKIELRELASITKIGVSYLRNIEDERFEDLPAPVYIRGFVVLIAKALRIDPNVTAASYMKRLRD